MAKIYTFPKSNKQENILYLKSFIQNNIIQLTEMKKKVLNLEKDIKKLKQLKLIQNANGKESKPKK